MNSKNNTIPAVLFILVFLFFNNCKDKDPGNGYYYIPDVYVNINITLTLPSYSNLTIPGNYIYLANTYGYKGIILIHYPNSGYVAYDRACSYQPDNPCSLISMDISNLFMRCGKYEGSNFTACCQSTFDLDGNPLTGPAQYPLKKYKVIQTGNNLEITN